MSDVQDLVPFLGHFSPEAMQITIIENVNQNDEWMKRVSHGYQE